MNQKILIATVVYNSQKITNECFLTSLFKHSDISKFDLFIVNTDKNYFQLDKNFEKITNIRFQNYQYDYNITDHELAIQKILDDCCLKYDDIIICENDVVIKQDLLTFIDRNYQFCGMLTKSADRGWFTGFYEKFKIQCNRWLPQLMYFNIPTYTNRKPVYSVRDVNAFISIPSLELTQTIKNEMFADPGWYFLLWTIKNKIKCKDVDINTYIDHMWCGSEHRSSKEAYIKLLENFKQKNNIYL